MFTPTYLYIKRHKITGLQYFGKTINDPYKYMGSGKRWLNHIKKHGVEHVETVWVKLFQDKETLTSFAKDFSLKNNIVESKDWANLCIENGTDGGLRHNSSTVFDIINSKPKSDKWRNDVSNKLKGNKHRALQVIIDNVIYPSITNAAIHHNVSDAAIHYWIKKGKASRV